MVTVALGELQCTRPKDGHVFGSLLLTALHFFRGCTAPLRFKEKQRGDFSPVTSVVGFWWVILVGAQEIYGIGRGES
jgi:hypothetical protein